jgi:hypothetical protein
LHLRSITSENPVSRFCLSKCNFALLCDGTERKYEIERETFTVSGPVVAGPLDRIIACKSARGSADFILPLQKFSVTVGLYTLNSVYP